MTTKYQSEKGEISPVQTAEHKFPIYFCEECGRPMQRMVEREPTAD